MFAGPFSLSMIKRAVERGLIQIRLHSIRDSGLGRHRQVDDTPCGGGPGMVLKAEVLDRALRRVMAPDPGYVIYLCPQGKRFDQVDAKRLATEKHLILICGHYEGVDDRFIQRRVDEQLSLGDFVLTGGEIPAMAVVDAVARLQPGVLSDKTGFTQDSFYHGLLEHPHFTRPAQWRSDPEGEVAVVPDVLLSGHHGAVAAWRRRQSLLITLIRRPELLQSADLSRAERRLLLELARDLETMNLANPLEETPVAAEGKERIL